MDKELERLTRLVRADPSNIENLLALARLQTRFYEPPKKKSVLDPIKLTGSEIFEADAFEFLQRLPRNFFQFLLTDSPYNVSKKNNLHTMPGRQGIDFAEWDKGFDQVGWIKHAIPLLVPGASIIIWNDWKNLGFIADALITEGCDVKRILTWKKKNPFPRNIRRSLVQATEHALWAVKPKGKWKFNKRDNVSYETGIFEYPVQSSKQHPTKKPDGMFGELIEIFTDSGDWVLDPFCGVGTTNWAAERLGRYHVGIDNVGAYVKTGRANLAQVRQELAKV